MRLNVRRVVNGVRNIKYGISAIMARPKTPTKPVEAKAKRALPSKPKTPVSPKASVNPQHTTKPATKKRWK